MGSCCSTGKDQPLSNSPSYSKVTDSILQLRQPTVELQEADVQLLVEEKLQEAYEWQLTCMKAVLKQPALDAQEFDELMDRLATDAKNYFRTLFLQGTTGENVPFAQIEQSENTLLGFCKSDSALFRYCNLFKSFTVCSGLKRELVKEHSAGKAKLLKLYDSKAQGPYASRCRDDLEQLLTMLGRCQSMQEVTCKLEAQLVMDQDILATKLSKAQEKAKTKLGEVFDNSAEGPLGQSSMTKTMLQSYASVVDLFNRIESSPGTCNSYAYSASLGSQKDPIGLKKPSSDEPPKREDSGEDRKSQHSESSSSLQGENSLNSRLMCMDRETLSKLE